MPPHQRENLEEERRELAQKTRIQLLIVTPIFALVLTAMAWLASRYTGRAFDIWNVVLLVILYQSGELSGMVGNCAKSTEK